MKIVIDGEIGWDVTSKSVRQQMKDIKPNEDLDIELSSIGGDVFNGVDIANLIRDHKGKTTITVSGLAASMGSYIMEMADVVEVHDNTSFMMHNPWTFAFGDYRDFKEDAKFLKSLTSMMTLAYSAKSGKSRSKIMQMMGDTTWLFGQEIVDAGFADKIIDTESKAGKEDLVTTAKLRFESCMAKLKDFKGCGDERSKVRASLTAGINSPHQGIKEYIKEDRIMDLTELKSLHPSLCAELIKEGETKGKSFLQDQINAHITMGLSSGAVELCLNNLKEGKLFGSAEVQAGYMSAGMNRNDLQNREEDNPEGDLGGSEDSEPTAQAKEKELIEKAMKLSNKSQQPGA